MIQTNRSSSKMTGKSFRHVSTYTIVQKTERYRIKEQPIARFRPCVLSRPKTDTFSFVATSFLKRETGISVKFMMASISGTFNSFVSSQNPLSPPKKRQPFTIQNPEQDTIFPFYIVLAIFFHLTCLLFLIGIPRLFHLPQNPYGNAPEGQQPVEVVYVPQQTGNSGLMGEGQDGKPAEPPPPAASLSEPKELPPPPVEEIQPLKPASLAEAEKIPETIPEAATEAVPQQKPLPPKKPNRHSTTKELHYTYHYVPHRPRVHTAQKTQTTSPFDNLSSLDFNEDPHKSRRKKATRAVSQGSKSAINLSTGPLVKNGKINVPYAAKISIKGVNDNYGQEVAAWIYQHMYYPLDAARRGEDGSPSVHVVLNRDGQVVSVTLTNSSGSEALDDAITGMFRNAQLPKIPPELPDHYDMDLQINYILLRG